ncbi:MAG TPA: YihY/virulence factor BrkB family protein [Thermodesulfobacteriota bacterium]|nr:YihY/virulence factor BrkB family protein [Thermodesulfobacteriota bacterium]
MPPRRLEKIAAFWKERARFELRAAWDILWEARRAFTRDGCMNLAAAVAFYSILGAIPFLFLIVSATAYVLGSSDRAHVLAMDFLNQYFPETSGVIFDQVRAVSRRAGLLGWVGILSMFWTASVIFSSLDFALAVVFRVEKRRGFLKGKLLALAMVPGAGALFLLSIFGTAFSGVIDAYGLSLLGINVAQSVFFEFLVSYLFPYLILAFAFTAIYRVVPNTRIAMRHALVGGMSGAFLFEVAKHFFTWYVSRSPTYNIIYGSLEALVILVLWAFYSSTILLFCAEVVSAYRRRDVTLLEKAFL